MRVNFCKLKTWQNEMLFEKSGFSDIMLAPCEAISGHHETYDLDVGQKC